MSTLFSRFFGKTTQPRKTAQEWKQALLDQSDEYLLNIAKNPGEFVIEMRQAAAELIEQRKDTNT